MASESLPSELKKQIQELAVANAGLQKRVADLEREKVNLTEQMQAAHLRTQAAHIDRIDRLNADIQILQEHIQELAEAKALLDGYHSHSTEIKDQQAEQILRLQNVVQQLQGKNADLIKAAVNLTEGHAKLRLALQNARLKLEEFREFYKFLRAELGEEQLENYRKEYQKSYAADKQSGKNFKL